MLFLNKSSVYIRIAGNYTGEDGWVDDGSQFQKHEIEARNILDYKGG